MAIVATRKYVVEIAERHDEPRLIGPFDTRKEARTWIKKKGLLGFIDDIVNIVLMEDPNG